jgi:hypothetical protein
MPEDSEFRGRVATSLCLLASLASLSPTRAGAQPFLDSFVSGARVAVSNGCAVMTVKFNSRIRYSGHFPVDRGDELRISLHALDPESVEWIRGVHHEGVNLVGGAAAGVHSVTVDADQPTGPQLRIQFDRPVAYEVKQSGSFENLTIVFPAPGSKTACKASASAGANSELNGGGDGPLPVSRKALSAADLKFIEASMDEARAAIKRQRFEEAMGLLNKVLKLPENEHSAEARELLAKAKDMSSSARSQIELQDYMLRLPEKGETRDFRRSFVPSDDRDATRAQLLEPKPTPKGNSQNKDETQFSISGGVSSFYVRDDSVNTSKDISIAPDPSADPDAHRVHQNMFLTNFDLYGIITNDVARSKFKISGTDEQSAQSGSIESNRYGVATAFWETAFKETDLTVRIGRQTRNTGGVIGRFDGSVVSWAFSDSIKLNAVGGAANWSRFDAPFKDQRYLYGASVDVAKPIDGLDTSFYAIQQNDRWVVDRRAIGAEFRYFKDNKSAIGTIDYDVYFGKLNAAIGSGSWTFADKSVLSGALDYRRVPYLATWNALEGQPFLTLYDMLKFDTLSDTKQFAADRTPVFESAMTSYSRPINENYQVIVDGTVTHLSGTPPSGGVDGTLPTGTEYYLSGQLMAQNIFLKGDMYTGAIRYAHLADSRVYFLDLNFRYPLTDDLRLNPRLRVGLREGTQASPTTPLLLAGPSITISASGVHEMTVLPSLLLDYAVTKDIAAEAEIGAKWISGSTGAINSTTKDVYVTIGLRSSFSNEGAYRCAGILAPCIGMLNALPRGDEVAKQETFYVAATEPPPTRLSEPPLFLLEGGVRYVGTNGHNAYDYFADDTSSLRVSRLAYGGLWSNSGEAFFRGDVRRGILRNVFVKGFGGGGKITRGTLYDEDFPPLIDYSKTLSQSLGSLRYGAVDLGYNVYTNPLLRLGAFVGFHSWLESVNASGCSQVATNPYICSPPIPTGIRVVNERDRWNSFRAGGVLDVNLTDRLSLNAEAALVAVSQHAQDTHYFTFGADPAIGDGAGFEAESVLKYQLTDSLSVGVGGRWWHYNTHALDMFGQLLNYRTDRIGAFGQASYKIDVGGSASAGDAKE